MRFVLKARDKNVCGMTAYSIPQTKSFSVPQTLASVRTSSPSQPQSEGEGPPGERDGMYISVMAVHTGLGAWHTTHLAVTHRAHIVLLLRLDNRWGLIWHEATIRSSCLLVSTFGDGVCGGDRERPPQPTRSLTVNRMAHEYSSATPTS